MTTSHSSLRAASSGARTGMTLIEVILAVVILSGAMLGLANFGRKFQHQTSESTNQTLASDLATQRIEEIKGYRVYSTLVATYNGTTETTFPTDSLGYHGFTRTTAAVRTTVAAGATAVPPGNDYITVTVTVTGNTLVTPIKKSTIIALF
ncbi:MAG: prepilin-type N-terminal cleavage/methylation domain-containing protein [Gemmatimonadales bacterium]